MEAAYELCPICLCKIDLPIEDLSTSAEITASKISSSNNNSNSDSNSVSNSDDEPLYWPRSNGDASSSLSSSSKIDNRTVNSSGNINTLNIIGKTIYASVVDCKSGHKLQLWTKEGGWRCDASNEPTGCRCQDGSYASVQYKSRWRCVPCDFDYCGPCYESKLEGAFANHRHHHNDNNSSSSSSSNNNNYFSNNSNNSNSNNSSNNIRHDGKEVHSQVGGARLNCGHVYCSPCLQEYIKYEVKLGNAKIKCCGKSISNSSNSSSNINNSNSSSNVDDSSDNSRMSNGAYSISSIAEHSDAGSGNYNRNNITTPPLSNSNDSNGNGSSRPVEAKKCGKIIEGNEIERIFAKSVDGLATIKLYNKFKILKSSNFARECPYCHMAEVYNDENLPIVQCQSCNEKFCFYHSLAHQIDMKCEDYEMQLAPMIKLSEELIYKNCKPCPSCTLLVTKSGGCNHMKCSYCKQSFCWICGKAVDDSVFPAHFQWWNIFGCTNMQMDESIEVNRRTVLYNRLLGVLELIFIGPPTFVSTISSIVACFPCLLFCNVKGQEVKSFCTKLKESFTGFMTFWGMIWISVLFFFPVFTIAGLFAFSFFVLCYPCYFIYRRRLGQAPCPDWLMSFCRALYRLCCGIRSPAGGIIDEANSLKPPFVNILSDADTIIASSLSIPRGTGSSKALIEDGASAYLNFDKISTHGFIVTPMAGSTIIIGITVTTANDCPERDPTSWTVSGSNDGGLEFDLIATGSIPATSLRLHSRNFFFVNTIQYSTYKVSFPTVDDLQQANIEIQIKSVGLLRIPPLKINKVDGDVDVPVKETLSRFDIESGAVPTGNISNMSSNRGNNSTAWTCDVCTFINRSLQASCCEVCGTIRKPRNEEALCNDKHSVYDAVRSDEVSLDIGFD